MGVIYLSYFIDNETPLYGGKQGEIDIKPENLIVNGDSSNNSVIRMPSHVGTHIDFPYHFSETGSKSNDYPASFWIFNKVGFIDCKVEDLIDKLDTFPSDIEILILKTGFGSYRGTNLYWEKQPVIPSFYANAFKNKFPKLRVFGFDMISLTSRQDRQEGKFAHVEFLLSHNILILEDMDLSSLDKTPEMVVLSPLQINALDGVPCNVMAFIN
jgi:arylformamidase